jgi:hypothetical protein
MKHLKLVALGLAVTLMVVGCKKEETGKQNSEQNNPTETQRNFISFKYGGTEYVIEQKGMLSIVTYGQNEDGIAIYGQDGFKTVNINIFKEVAVGNTYDIYAVTPNKQPDFFIQISLNLSVSDISFSSNSEVKIGKLYISEFSDNRISGTFQSKMQNGEITDGKFSATTTSDIGSE